MRLIFAALIFFFSFSPMAKAHFFVFEQRLYDALDLIELAVEKENLNFYYQAAEPLRAAALITQSQAAKEKLEEAMAEIVGTQKFDAPHSQANIPRSQIQWALKLHRDQIKFRLSGELKFVENLVKTHLFPEMDPKDVNITFDGPKEFNRRKGLALLASFISDPRSVNYDDQVAQIITGKSLDGKEGQLKVTFSSNTLARTSSRDEAKSLSHLMNTLLEESTKESAQVAPIQMKYKILNKEYLLYFEVQSYKYASLLRISHTTFALLANECTTYKLIRLLEELTFFVTHLNAPFDSQMIKGGLSVVGGALDTARLGLVKQRDAAARIHQAIFRSNNAEAITKRFLDNMDAYIKHYEDKLKLLQESGGGGPGQGETGAKRGPVTLESFSMVGETPTHGPEGDGTREMLSREDQLQKKITELRQEKARVMARMEKALTNFREGGVELDVVKGEDGRWVKSGQNEVLSIEQYKEYLLQEMDDVKKLQEESKKLIQEEFHSRYSEELTKLEGQRNNAIEIEKRSYEHELSQRRNPNGNPSNETSLSQLEEAHQEKLRQIEVEYQQKKEALYKKHEHSYRTRLKAYGRRVWSNIQRLLGKGPWIGNYEKTLAKLQELHINAEPRAQVRAKNLAALPEYVRNAREASVIAKASGPWYGKHSVLSWNADRGLLLLSAFLAGIEVYQWQMARARAQTPEERFYIWQDYGPRILHKVMYCAPVFQEAAFLIDLTYWTWNIVKHQEIDKFNGTELLIRQLVYGAEWLGYAWSGSSSWEVTLHELTGVFRIPSLLKLSEDHLLGEHYADSALIGFVNSQQTLDQPENHTYEDPESLDYITPDLSTNEQKAMWVLAKRLDYIRSLQEMARQQLALVLEFNYELAERFGSEIEAWLIDSDEKLFGPKGLTEAARKAILMSQLLSERLESPARPAGQ